MPQTLGAFLAIVAVMTFALNYHRSTLHAQHSVINSEYEVMGSAVAADVMNYIASKPFDARTADNTVSRTNKNTLLLTGPAEFGGCADFDLCNDIDDFDGLASQVRSFEVEPGVSIDFLVDVKVKYVDDAGNTATSPTWAKEVAVRIASADSVGSIPRLIRPIQLRRQFSPQW